MPAAASIGADMADIDFSEFIAVAVDNDTHRRPWPIDGQEFEVELLVEGEDQDDREITIVEGADDAQISEVLSDFGTSVTCDLFLLTEAPEELGRHKATLKFWLTSYRDWESGHEECNYGFHILKHERITE